MKNADAPLQLESGAGEITIHLQHTTLQIACTTEGIFRIWESNKTPFTGYALAYEPAYAKIESTDHGDHIVLHGKHAVLKVYKSPLRLIFETPDGVELSADDPGLGTCWDADGVTVYKKLQPGERFFGLGQKTGPLDKVGKQYRNWNTDAYGYTPSTDPLYVSCPFYLGMSHERWYGIFLNNHSETVFNFGAANDRFSFFQARNGVLDYFFFAGANPAQLVRDYTALTGRMELPPLWSLGFQQCRYSYYPAEDLLRVARTFREKRLPADVLYFDIHYMQDFKVFTWHQEHFPKPEETLKALKELHFHPVVILDPGIKREEGYDVYEEGRELDAFAKYPDGEPYAGGAWPGWCHFPDFTRSDVRTWWAGRVAALAAMGVEGFWNDMNEPAVWGHFTPNLIRFHLEGQGGSHREAHNIYGMQMTRATVEGARQARPEMRSFILTRATFSGGQRYGAQWTGDNHANDEHLLLGARLITNMGLSGFPFTGNDVGGFTGNASAALYRRWIAQAVFQPLMRAHSMINSLHAEPWSFGEETLEITRNYLGLRYMILPHLYSLFYEHTRSGLPPARALLFDHADQWKIYTRSFENQFKLGSHLLVCPVESHTQVAKVYLPKGQWYHFFNDTTYEGPGEQLIELQNDTIPLFVQAGGILPMQDVLQHSAEQGDGILRLHIYHGAQGDYTLYEDDGISTAYNRGGFALRQIELRGNTLTVGAQEGHYPSKYKQLRLYLHGMNCETAYCNQVRLKINREDFRFMPKISNFDPYEVYPDSAKLITGLCFLEADWVRDELKISFSSI